MSENQLRQHMEKRVRDLHAERRNNVIVAVVLNLLVMGYLGWIHSQINYLTEPENLVDASAGFVEAHIPQMKESVAATIKVESPGVARFLADAVRAELPGMIRQMLENMVMEYTTELASFAADEYNRSFTAMVDLADAEIKAAAEATTDQERELIVMGFLEKQVDQTVASMNKEADSGELLTRVQASHQALVSLNKRVSAITTGAPNATRKDKLTRNFLYTLWRFIQKEYPAVTETGEDVH